mmetsp:Transcript_12556/g.28032  ORF Transcript_12556/g.28032 Transcript_12556/m.28032 type:complete len:257 (-) Transcript_12556:831-1601(-)
MGAVHIRLGLRRLLEIHPLSLQFCATSFLFPLRKLSFDGTQLCLNLQNLGLHRPNCLSLGFAQMRNRHLSILGLLAQALALMLQMNAARGGVPGCRLSSSLSTVYSVVGLLNSLGCQSRLAASIGRFFLQARHFRGQPLLLQLHLPDPLTLARQEGSILFALLIGACKIVQATPQLGELLEATLEVRHLRLCLPQVNSSNVSFLGLPAEPLALLLQLRAPRAGIARCSFHRSLGALSSVVGLLDSLSIECSLTAGI